MESRLSVYHPQPALYNALTGNSTWRNHIDPNQFDETLRRTLNREPFAPFWVQLDDGQKIRIRQPVLAYGDGGASFIDPDDGALVSFYHDHVAGFCTAAH
jgi:hypothetical protein